MPDQLANVVADNCRFGVAGRGDVLVDASISMMSAITSMLEKFFQFPFVEDCRP